MSWIEYLKQADFLLGLMLAVAGVLAYLARWFWRSVSKNANTAVSPVRDGQEDIVRRLTDVETGLAKNQEDVQNLQGQLSRVEANLATLATTKDVNEIRVSVARVETVASASQNMIDTLYAAVLRASGDPK